MTFFPVQSSLLDARALVHQVLSDYDLPEPISCKLYLRGDNDTYLVQAGDQTHYLRVYTHKSEQEYHLRIATEIDLLEIAHAAGVPVARALPRKDGSYLNLLSAPEGIRPAVLFEGVPGVPPERNLTPEQARAYGKAVGELHKAWMVDQVLPLPVYDAVAVMEEPLRRLEPYLQDRPEDFAFLQRTADLASIYFSQLPDHAAAYGVIHGDLHKTNVLITETGDLHLIDFTTVGYGWRAHELAVLLWSTALVSDFEPRKFPQVFEAYLEGYESVRPLDEAERRALPHLAAAQHLWIMGVEVDLVESGRSDTHWITSQGWLDQWIGWLRAWVRLHE
ncbi:phosphotransferase enzyme family protein [Deinococcus cellulosilyticus]|uniref:Aminoglycoside phosphotransferase domain-containing protein n=1 Tax=Deinococcus cellulosilyticus (strain DSM 18568 / NBRC 106333 / KACC 11606 / 5516J-15) TaxID=1223518 RepID=A0A511MWH6_DEIC1|nr:phosphotransferase [Deinococcus cellulosilyticus]GEM44527.1 hypothetical protein DC3_01620 [Deinococcus cellulosilyticus NBRC 106333 = KACC 11606]